MKYCIYMCMYHTNGGIIQTLQLHKYIIIECCLGIYTLITAWYIIIYYSYDQDMHYDNTVYTWNIVFICVCSILMVQ